MSSANADWRNPAASLNEWRVGEDEPAKPGAAPPAAEGEWSQADASLRRARVSADLESWREDLAQRMGRLERRLNQASDSSD
jgi:hypothetical protein